MVIMSLSQEDLQLVAAEIRKYTLHRHIIEAILLIIILLIIILQVINTNVRFV